MSYLESPTLICLSLCNFYGATMKIKGSLLLSAPTVKHFQATKNCPVLAKIWQFLGINRNLILNLSFITQKGTSLRHFTSNELLRVKIHQPVWPVRESQKKGINKNIFCYISPICPEALSGWICTKFGIGGPLADVINCAEFFFRLVQGYWFCRGLKFAYSHRNWSTPLTLSELPFRLW